MSMHSQVLSLIRSHVSTSQSEIRTETGLSASAVSNSVKRESARLHHLVAGVVDCRRLVVDTTDQGHLIHDLRHSREDFRDS